VRRRRATQAICVAAVGLVTWLAPATAALAESSSTSHQSATHPRAPKNAVPHGVLCREVKAQQTSRSHLALDLATALRSGRTDKARLAMLRVLDADLKKEGTAQKALRNSPTKVRRAENHLVADVERVKASVVHATNVTQLLKAFGSFGHDTHMAVDGLNLASWYSAQCLTPHASTAYPNASGSSSGTPGSATSTTSSTGATSGSP
jgi:hypothetical protein